MIRDDFLRYIDYLFKNFPRPDNVSFENDKEERVFLLIKASALILSFIAFFKDPFFVLLVLSTSWLIGRFMFKDKSWIYMSTVYLSWITLFGYTFFGSLFVRFKILRASDMDPLIDWVIMFSVLPFAGALIVSLLRKKEGG